MHSNRNVKRCFSRENREESRGDPGRDTVGDIAGEVLPARGGMAVRDCDLWMGCPHWGTDTGSPARLWLTDRPCWNSQKQGAMGEKEEEARTGKRKPLDSTYNLLHCALLKKGKPKL